MTKNEVTEIAQRLAKIEEQLRGIHRTLKPLVQIPVNVENAKVRIEALEECNRETKRLRWRSVTAIVAALMSGLAGVITAWWQ